MNRPNPHPPEKSQYLAALGKGSTQRVASGAAKKALASGELHPTAALKGDSPDHEYGIGRTRAYKLLVQVPGIGPATAKEILKEAGVEWDSFLSEVGWGTRGHLAELVSKATELYGRSAPPVVPDTTWIDNRHAEERAARGDDG